MGNLEKEANERYKEETKEWAEHKLNELLRMDKFKEMGKADDTAFQTLVFLGLGAQQLSLGNTILRNAVDTPSEWREELQSIQRQLQDLQDRIRTGN